MLTAALIALIGWRWTFVAFGLLGVVWAVPFAAWYRDDPQEHPSVAEEERALLRSWRVEAETAPHPAPWGRIARNRSVWGLSLSAFSSAFGWYFFITWLPTYLEQVRRLDPLRVGWLAGLPLLLGIPGCLIGGWVSDALVGALGSPRWARRIVGATGQTLAGASFLLGVRSEDAWMGIALLGLASFWNDVPLSSLWAANMDVGERHAGIVSGVVSAASAAGAFVSPLLFGALLEGGWGWTPALLAAGASFLAAGASWLLVDPTRGLCATEPTREGGDAAPPGPRSGAPRAPS